jgi:hypothetical protein
MDENPNTGQFDARYQKALPNRFRNARVMSCGLTFARLDPPLTKCRYSLRAHTRRARDGGTAGFEPTLKVPPARPATRWRSVCGTTAQVFLTKPTGEGTGLGLSIKGDVELARRHAAVFDLITRRARELCDSQAAAIYEYDGELVHINITLGVLTVFRQELRLFSDKELGLLQSFMYFTHSCRPRDPLESVVSNGANVSAQLERCSPRSDISSELPYPFHSNGLGGGCFDRAQADIHLVGELVEVIWGRVYARPAGETLNSMTQEFDRLTRSVDLLRVWPKLPGGVCLEGTPEG